jgi:hypothetical protein
MFAGHCDLGMALDELGALCGEPLPGVGHFQQLVALRARHAGGEMAAFDGVQTVFGRFFNAELQTL